MSEAKKAGELPSSALAQLIGLDSSGNCARRKLSDARQELWAALFTAIDMQLSKDCTEPGYYRIKSEEEPPLPDGTKLHPWGTVKCWVSGNDLHQMAFATNGKVAYRFVSNGTNFSREWTMLS